MDTLKIFGQRLRELRMERKFSQKEMAELLGKTLRHYQKIEHREVNVPSLTLRDLADHFGVSMDYLYGRTDHR